MTSRRLSEIDPLDTTTFRTQSHDNYDVAGGSQLPPVHLTRSRSNTGGRRSRSSSLFNSAFGRKEAEDEGVAGPTGAGVDKEYTIQEHPDESESDPISENSEQAEKNDSQNGDISKQQSIKQQPTSNAPDAAQSGQVSEAGTSTVINEKAETKKRRHATIMKVVFMFARVYIIMFCLFIGILSVYWGSLYDRASHYHKIRYLVVLGETNIDSIPPLFSSTLSNILKSETIQRYGTWDIQNYTTFSELALSHNNTLREEVIRQVHHQNYWGGIYVPQNLTYNYYQALLDPSSNFMDAIEFIYETGRNPQSVPGYVVSTIQSIEKSFVSLGASSIIESLVSNLSSDQVSSILSTNPQLLSSLWWSYYDNRPSFGSIVVGVVQIGLLYLLVLSFHQFNFASATHQMIATKIHSRQYILYHVTTSQLAYLVLSLIYSLMTLAFQVPINNTFGRSGFLVEWAIVYLTMSALGGVNENAAMQIFARYKPVIGFWVVFYLAINVSVIFSPLVVMNNFYRYGYAMPMYQGNELLKVVFLNTYKGNMGRNIGVLIAWIVLMNAILPLNLRNVRAHTRKVEARARAALEKNK